MTRTLLALSALAVLAAGCAPGVDPNPQPTAAPITAEVPIDTVTTVPVGAGSAAVGRVAGTALQRAFYFRAMAEAYSASGMTDPAGTSRYAVFASSVCDFLDAGASVGDATAVITDYGFTAAQAGELMPLAIGGYCTEHLPT